MTSTQTPPMANNITWKDGELFRWSGAELTLTPIMIPIGFVGNLLVFYIYQFRWRSTTVTLFKRMLAVLDLSSLLLAFPTLLYTTVSPHSESFKEICIFGTFMALTTAIASGLVLVIIAVDRFMKLCQLRKTGIGGILAKKLFAASVTFALLISIPSCWIYGRDTIYIYDYHVRVFHCFIHSDSREMIIFIVFAVMVSVVYLAVSTTLIVLYYKIIKTFRQLSAKHEELKRRPSLATRSETLQKQKQSQVMRNSAIVFIAVTIVFYASYTPYFAILTLSLVKPEVKSSMGPGLKALHDLAKILPIVNNVANPFIYSFTSEPFRKEVKKMLTFKSCKKGFFRRRAHSPSDRSHDMSHFSDSRESPVKKKLDLEQTATETLSTQ